MQTYQEIFERIEKLENSETHQRIIVLEAKIKNLENQKTILLEKIKEQEKWHNLFFYEQSLRTQYQKTLRRVESLPLYSRVFQYKSIIRAARKSYK